MKEARQAMIAALTGELSAVRPMRPRTGAALVAAAAAATFAAVAALAGVRWSVFRGDASPFFWVTAGLLLLLGLAAASAVIAMARPGVGNRYDAPKWAAAMVAVLPCVAVATMFSYRGGGFALLDPHALRCVMAGLGSSLLTGAALVLWLRRGAPVSTATAGWYTGIAAGALGTVAYGFSCSIETLAHLGIWHVVPVAAAGVLGRFTVPALVRW